MARQFVMVSFCGVLTAASGFGLFALQTPPEPGATPGVLLTNISKNTAAFASVFPQVAVSRANPNLVAVAWRRYNLPIDTNAPKPDRIAECYISISMDGGQTFIERNMMSELRTRGGDGQPELWGCNAPWTAIANDGTIYFGGSLFTAGGVLQTEPKQGRAGVTVSTDGGKSWSKAIFGIALTRLAPGLKGLQGGMNPEDTPWDGANGVIDPQTSVFYSATGGYVSASTDRAKSFGTVYQSRGTLSASHGTLIASRTVQQFVGAQCPCLVANFSGDDGKSWTESLVAQKQDYSPTGTVRYPISAASPAEPGHFAVGVYQTDHVTVRVYLTSDSGKTWKSATPRPAPRDVPINSANQVAVGYTTDGHVLLTWRAFTSLTWSACCSESVKRFKISVWARDDAERCRCGDQVINGCRNAFSGTGSRYGRR
jgi:hypothetical protein